jgi:hypothetical protein
MMRVVHAYEVTVVDEGGEVDEAMRARLSAVAAYRLATLEEREGHYPEAGGAFDMLDHFDGPFFWERTDAEMVDDPASRVDFEVVAVEPAEPAPDGVVRVSVRVVF